MSAQVVALTVALGVLAGVLSGGEWPWVLVTYLRWSQTLIAVVAAAVLLRLRWWRSGLASAAVAAGLVVSVVAPLRALETVAAPQDRTLRIAVHNTGYGAGDVEALAQAIRDADLDLVVLLESEDVAGVLADELGDLSLLPAPGRRGRDTTPPMILARRSWPTDVVPLGAARPTTVVHARIADRPLDVVTIHPLPPLTAGWSASHDRSIATLVDDVLPRDGPYVVACDCNTTPWSPSMARLLDAGLRGPTVAPTYGAPLLGIPLDHVLLSDGVAAVSREQWPFSGSDHRMIVTEVTLR
ncbi:MAG TPA: endonuclease/exonuclease/phosphatase family protein [Euzebyales bacterium]|nr:endonuclease/exonuclease/phosphatase family protein [Euzebyales bacterium]